MEFRRFRVDLAAPLPPPPMSIWNDAFEVVRIEVPVSVAKGLYAYLLEALPQVNRSRIEEDAKWQADRR